MVAYSTVCTPLMDSLVLFASRSTSSRRERDSGKAPVETAEDIGRTGQREPCVYVVYGTYDD